MTLSQCEYNGRYYGGGVNELVPSEFKESIIPYRLVSKEDITIFKRLFKDKASTKEIVRFVNSKTIDLEFEKDKSNKFEEIRLKLIKRRMS